MSDEEKLVELWRLFLEFSKLRPHVTYSLDVFNDTSGRIEGSALLTGSVKIFSWTCFDAGIYTLRHALEKRKV